MIEIGIRIILFVIGAALSLFIFGLYESQERELQSRLERMWIVLDDLKRPLVTISIRLFHRATILTTMFLDKLFGSRLLALRTLIVAINYSLASFLFVVGAIGVFDGQGEAGRSLIAISSIFFLISLSPAVSHWFLAPAAVSAILMIGLFFHSLHSEMNVVRTSSGPTVVGMLGALPWAIISELLLISRLRHSIRLSETDTELRQILRKLGRWAFWVFLIVIIPALLSVGIREIKNIIYGTRDSTLFPEFHNLVIKGLLFAAFMNVLRGLPLFALLTVAFMLVMNKFLWPVWLRILYGLQRDQVFKHSKLLISIGIAFIILSLSPKAPTWRSVFEALIEKA